MLVKIDYCTIINSVNPSQLYVYGRTLTINTIFLSQKYNKVSNIIRENCNVFVFIQQFIKAIKYFIFEEIGDKFDNDKTMKDFLTMNIKQNMISFCIIKMKVNNIIELLVRLHLTNVD